VTWSFLFFGVSMVLFGVVRATGAVMAPLFILTLSLLVVRFPVAEALLDRPMRSGGAFRPPRACPWCSRRCITNTAGGGRHGW
jgi:hypothetical protein